MQFQRTMTRICGLLCASLWLCAGCEPEADSATAVAISVQSNLEDLAKVEVAVFASDANPSRATPDEDKLEAVDATLDDLPVSIAVVRGKSNEVTIAVRALDRLDNVLAEARVRTSFVQGKTLRLPVFLGEVCRDVLCNATPKQTCYAEPLQKIEAGECGPIPLVRGKDLEEIKDRAEANDWDASDFIVDMDAETSVPDDGRDADTGIRDADAGDAGDAGDADSGPPDGHVPDANVCKRPPLMSAQCGLFPQCDCAEGQACRIQITPTATTACEAAGSTLPNTGCSKSTDCQAGHSCIFNGSTEAVGRCAAYCEKDSDCGAGGICDKIVDSAGNPIAGAGACYVACNPTTSDPCGSGVACAKFTSIKVSERVLNGNYCVPPFMKCPFQNNGICDDPSGTRFCVAGSDAADCCKVTVPAGGACDLVSSCGCTGTTPSCEVKSESNGVAVAACRAVGAKPREGVCTFSTDCVAGTDCIGGICRKYCSTPADCGSAPSTCRGISINSMTTTVAKVCFATCDPAVASSCASGATCPNVSGDAQRTCRAVACSGTLLTNGVCDEVGGTGLCMKGTDVDCGPAMCVAPLPMSPPTGPCDLATQCGCPATTPACRMTSFTAEGVATIGCVAPGTITPGTACTEAGTCTKGFECFGGTCVRYCRNNAECGGVGTCSQLATMNGTGPTVGGVRACLK